MTKVMIVEDEIIIAEDIKYGLINSGYTVVAVIAEGEKIIEANNKYKPDVILMDIMLGGLKDGIDYANELKELSETPVIFLTAFADDFTISRAKQTSPYGYLLKPFTERELYAAIETALYRVEMEKTLKRSEKRYRDLFEQSNDAIMILDLNGKIQNVNYKTCSMLGYSYEYLIAMHLSQLITQRKLIYTLEKYNQLLKTHKMSYETQFKKKIGKNIDVELKSKIISTDEKLVQCIVRDITAQKKMLKEIELLHKAIEQSKLAIIITNRQKDIIYANKSVSTLLGYSLGELFEMNIKDLFQSSNIQDDMDILFKGLEVDGDYNAISKTGKRCLVNTSISTMINTKNEISNYMIVIKETKAII